MTQYKEQEANYVEGVANLASGRGDHGLANQLWRLAAEIGTRLCGCGGDHPLGKCGDYDEED